MAHSRVLCRNGYTMADERQVSYCTAVKNRADNLERLCQSLTALSDKNFELVVCDFSSTDNITDVLKNRPFPVTYVQVADSFFNRSQGLNIAAEYASAKPEDLVFFIDVDMLVPADFNEIMRSIVTDGVCWFPICYSLHADKPIEVYKDSRHKSKANGWWRKEGKGMCGFTQANFSVVRFNEHVGISYGREDGDICRRCIKQFNFDVVRGNCSGLYHIWHPTNTAYRTGNHKKTGIRGSKPLNAFADTLPRPSLTVQKIIASDG